MLEVLLWYLLYTSVMYPIKDSAEHLRSIDGQIPSIVQHVSALLRKASFPPLDIDAVQYNLFDPASKLRSCLRGGKISSPEPPVRLPR